MDWRLPSSGTGFRFIKKFGDSLPVTYTIFDIRMLKEILSETE